tara:strand:- start:380 stop:1279 length:900 start_codon:yes stop_codon:yes gene_type:complete
MTDNQHKEVKLDLGSPLGCGLAVIVFGFAVISLNAEFFTDLSNWKLYGEGYKETKTFWIHQFFNVPSIIIVFVGTITALVISQPLDRLKNIPIILSNVWKTENWSYMGIIDQMCGYADQARKKGTFSLDKQVQELPDGFLKKGMDLMISTPDANKLKSHMFTEMVNISSRHKNGADLFKKGEKYAPSFGMMGTVMGLIVMMNNFDLTGKELDEVMVGLLGGMGTALITTLYGVILANFVFGPIAGKLETLSAIEIRHKTVLMEGILSIHAKEHPIIIRDKLMTFVPAADKDLESEEEVN